MTAGRAAASPGGPLSASLRPHQQQAVADVVAAFDRHERATATMPCGSFPSHTRVLRQVVLLVG